MDIQLFLAHADDHQPVIEEGMPWSAVHEVPAPAFAPNVLPRYTVAAPPDDLPEQGWGVIAAKGPEGDRLLRLIEPLRRHREEQQEAEAVIYRVDPCLDPGAATAWIQQDYWDAVNRRTDRLPRYLLVLGDAARISWDLQELLGAEAFVGRLAFTEDCGYEAYVDKAIRWDREEPVQGARVLFYTVQDGSRATLEGYRRLMRTSLEIARDGNSQGNFPATEIIEIGGGDGQLPSRDQLTAGAQQMLREAGSTRGGVLFSMSHGAGVPRAGWCSAAEQRALQGAMVISPSGDRLTAPDIAARPFLPGGVWFFFACYGAGTPARSAYFAWLDRLHRLGLGSSAERVLEALPRQGESPFVAALPDAALANPNGPLGVVGHVDLAWSWGFLDYDLSGAPAASRTRAERFQGILRAFVDGHRLGVAHHELARFFRSVSTELSTLCDEDARLGPAAEGNTDQSRRKARLAGLWMQRQDLCAYVLLGDPAARLPIARYPAGIRPPAPAVQARPGAPMGSPDVAKMEAAVLAVLRGMDTTSAIAARHGISQAELERWVGAFVDAGRTALASLR